ncbi:uncharacterized protein LOC113328867 [Papaver somniferum]|uniref:uncharacterized protein LOC113328867 n=1 Tax=Papaver somniferum TaxID=3469 RepID=UPI000E6FB403|nr:uncharacterized protein LOC113328867 [Papaver somniferum]
MSNYGVIINGRIIQDKIWRKLWKTKTAHRIKLIVWKCIHEDNSTRMKLSLHNTSIQTQCAICHQSEETMEHLLFNCRHAWRVWKMFDINIEEVQRRGISVSEWMESWFQNNNGAIGEKILYTMMLCVWIIWKGRCDVVFQGVSLNSFTSMHKIQYHLQSHFHDNNASTHNIKTHRTSHWKLPMHDILKLNVDASYDYDTNQSGIGIVIRSHTGKCEGIKGSYADGILSPEMSECMAVREALICAKDKQFQRIHIEADAKLVIQSITGDILLIQWENKTLLKEIIHLSSSFLHCSFSYIGRDNNRVADAVAKTVRGTTTNLDLINNFPEELCNRLASDNNLANN